MFNSGKLFRFIVGIAIAIFFLYFAFKGVKWVDFLV